MVQYDKLYKEKRTAIISALVEGCSIRSTVRMTGASINTVTKLLVDIGEVCVEYQDRVMKNHAHAIALHALHFPVVGFVIASQSLFCNHQVPFFSSVTI